MKALTLHGPYASAIAFGLKLYETRTRNTQYRGPIAIHAGKAFNQKAMDNLGDIPWSDHIKLPLSRRYSDISEEDFPKGAIVAIGELTDSIIMDQSTINEMTAQERSLGNWDIGNYAYKIENIQILKIPIPVKGKQGFWNVDADIMKQLGELDEITLSEPDPAIPDG